MENNKNTRTKLTAAAGMTLYNGESLGKEVYLGVYDSPENWQEIPDEEAEKLQTDAQMLG